MKSHLDSGPIFLRAFICLALLCAVTATAQLAVTVLPVKVIGQKAVVQIAMKNDLAEKVESARAACFLLNDKGKMAGQSTKWVIGQSKIGLESGATNTFNFVITSSLPLTMTNLTAKVSFTRISLAGGSVADVSKTVKMMDR